MYHPERSTPVLVRPVHQGTLFCSRTWNMRIVYRTEVGNVISQYCILEWARINNRLSVVSFFLLFTFLVFLAPLGYSCLCWSLLCYACRFLPLLASFNLFLVYIISTWITLSLFVYFCPVLHFYSYILRAIATQIWIASLFSLTYSLPKLF